MDKQVDFMFHLDLIKFNGFLDCHSHIDRFCPRVSNIGITSKSRAGMDRPHVSDLSTSRARSTGCRHYMFMGMNNFLVYRIYETRNHLRNLDLNLASVLANCTARFHLQSHTYIAYIGVRWATVILSHPTNR